MMSAKAFFTGTGAKFAIALTAIGALALPVAGALATPEDPTQPAATAAAAPAATAAAAATPLTAEQVTASRALFNQYSCGACHVLGDAAGTGQIGPSLDGNANLDHAFVVSRVSNGQGAMPGFGGMIAAGDIDQLATYIMQVKK